MYTKCTHIKRTPLLCRLWLYFSLLTIASATHAQTTTEQDLQALLAEADSIIDEILVIATRREEALQDVPVAVSVIDKADIETIKPKNLLDFSGHAPNVTIGDAGNHPGGGAFYIRGQGYQDIEKTQNPPVGLIIDGLVLGVSTGSIIDAFDLEQIEISRGPQGIFFGKNTTAGVINVRRSRPNGELGGKASLAYGSNNTQIIKGIFNTPIGNRGGLKLGATYNRNEGFTNNVFTGENEGGSEYSAVTVALDLDVSDIARLELTLDRLNFNGGGTPFQFGNVLGVQQLANDPDEPLDLSTAPNFNPVTGSPIGLGPRQVANDFENESGLETDMVNMTWIVDTAIGEITSVSGYIDSEDFQNADYDGNCIGTAGCPFSGPVNPLQQPLHTERPQEHRQFSQELRLAGSILEDKLDYLAGAYYYDEAIEFRQVINSFVTQDANQDTTSYSLFANADYHLTDSISLSGGFRYIDESKDFDTITTLGNGAIFIPQIDESGDFDEVITRFSIDWKPNPETLLYLSRAEGFRSGGFSIRGTLSEQVQGNTNCTPTPTPPTDACPENNFLAFDPENVTAYEAGIKSSLLDNQLTLNAALFYTEIDDLQATSIVVTDAGPSDTNTIINNLPEALIKGAEIETLFTPKSVPGLELSFLLGLTDGEIIDGTVPANQLPVGPRSQAGATATPVDIFRGTIAGLGRISDYNFNLSALYAFDLGEGKLTLKTDYNYLDDHGLSPSRGEQDLEDGYGLLNAYIGYAINNYTISLSGKNLTNEDYRTASLPAAVFNVWADQSNYLFEVQAEF